MQALEGRTWTWGHHGRSRGGFVRVNRGRLEWSVLPPGEGNGALHPALLRQTPEAFLAAGPPDLGADTPDAHTVEAISEVLLTVRQAESGVGEPGAH